MITGLIVLKLVLFEYNDAALPKSCYNIGSVKMNEQLHNRMHKAK